MKYKQGVILDMGGYHLLLQLVMAGLMSARVSLWVCRYIE